MLRRTVFLTLLATLAALGAGCPGSRAVGEAGQDCWDGKDNDGDGLVDCRDPDCALLAFCSAGLDGSVITGDTGSPRLDRGGPFADTGHADLAVRPPDHGSAGSSYGARCSTLGGYCADGQTVCLPGPGSASGFCSLPCTTLGTVCQGGPGGAFAACAFQKSGRNFCAFLCKWKGQSYPCPTGFSCVPDTSIPQYQSWCWP